MDKIISILKDTIEELLKIMGFAGEVKIENDQARLPSLREGVNDQENSIIVNINVPDGGMLIGQGGETLMAFQRLIRLMVAKKMRINDISEQKQFVLDVNHYWQDRTEVLKDFILDKADQAIRSQRTVILSPMSSYERRIVHLALKDNPNVLCQSEGEGEERHIVIKPVV
jgi:spoIIIJ-associated protein